MDEALMPALASMEFCGYKQKNGKIRLSGSKTEITKFPETIFLFEREWVLEEVKESQNDSVYALYL